MLGDVGGRIVAEVFIGLLEADQQSYRYYNLHGGKWNPTLPREKDDNFTIVDLLRFAGVPTQ
jgi:hypothetical protein